MQPVNLAACVQDQDGNDTAAIVEEMKQALQRVHEADLLELCVIHTSFAQTVENFFGTSRRPPTGLRDDKCFARCRP